jgi:gluconate 5-dehydrogenase
MEQFFDLSGKVAIVTGSSRGLGFGMAYALSRYGADIVVVNRNETSGKKAASSLQSEFCNRVLAVRADVSLSNEAENVVRTTLNEFGRIDILVNNAGHVIKKSALETTLAEWDQIFAIHLRAAFVLSKLVAPVMMSQKNGRIINISSQQASCAAPERASYSAAKKGLEQLTRNLATEWGPYNITVNCISPGKMLTELNPDINEQSHPTNIPIGRYGRVEDLYGIVVLLASEVSQYITGTNVLVDGGWSLIN